MGLNEVKNEHSLPIKCTFPNEQEDFKVSEFQGKMVRKLILSKNSNKKFRRIVYTIIDAFIRFKLSLSFGRGSKCKLKERTFGDHTCKNPEKHQRYLDYMNYRAFCAQMEITKNEKEKTIESICHNEINKLQAKIDEEKNPEEIEQLNKELKKYKNHQGRENLRKELNDKKEALIERMKTLTLKNKNDLLLEKLNEIEEPSEKKLDELIKSLPDGEDLKKNVQNQDPGQALEELKQAVTNSNQEIEQKQKEKLDEQIEKIKEAVQNQKMDHFSANKLLRKIASSYSIFPKLYEEMKKIDEENFNHVIQAIDNGFKEPEVVDNNAAEDIPNNLEAEPEKKIEDNIVKEPEAKKDSPNPVKKEAEPKPESPKAGKKEPESKIDLQKNDKKKVETQKELPKTDKKEPKKKGTDKKEPKAKGKNQEDSKPKKDTKELPAIKKGISEKEEDKENVEDKNQKEKEKNEAKTNKGETDKKLTAPADKQTHEINEDEIEIKKPEIPPLTEEQIAKLKDLLKDSLKNEDVNTLIKALNFVQNKDEELEFIDKLKALTLEERKEDFNLLVWYLIKPQERFAEQVKKFDIKKLNMHRDKLTELHNYLVGKLEKLEGTDLQKFNDKTKLLTYKLMSVEDELKVKEPKKKRWWHFG